MNSLFNRHLISLTLAFATLSCARGLNGKPSPSVPAPANSPAPNPDAAASILTNARYLSFAIRDLPPTADEAKKLGTGQAKLSALVAGWVASTEHQDRIKRYFTDLIGVSPSIVQLPPSYNLTKNAAGIYQVTDPRMSRSDCDASGATEIAAWWVESGQTVQVCKSIISTTLQPTSSSGTTLKCAGGANAFKDPACGCGPELIACYPTELQPKIHDAIRREFGERGAFVFLNKMSWQDLIGGDFLITNRYLAWWYLYTTKIGPASIDPSSAELSSLHSLDSEHFTRTDFPTFVTGGVTNGKLRAGVVTAPGFLAEFNTFRARIHGLVMALLCKDIDATLGTDMQSFLNTEFTAADTAHGAKSGCAACHYPMDNMASLDFGWNPNGSLQPKMVKDLSGHAFGADGNGPAFLATSFVERAPEFKGCMAKTAWQSFSGLSWDSLTASEQTALTGSVDTGPYTLIQAVLSNSTFLAARDGAPSVGTGTNGTSTLNFAADIAPILTAACGGTTCHSAGAANIAFVNDEATFRNTADAVVARTAPGGGMPPANSAKTLAPSDRAKLMSYLGK